MDQLKKLLVTLRILDDDFTVSLTSIVLMAAVVKFIMTPAMNVETLLALLGALAAHQAKKVINNKAAGSELEEKVADLGQKVQAMSVNVTTALNRTAPTVGVGMPRR